MMLRRWGTFNRGGVAAILLNNWTVGARYDFSAECWIWSIGPITWKRWKR